MPYYSFECEPCNMRLSFFCSIAELERGVECAEHGPMTQLWEPTFYKPFPAFTTTHIDGVPTEITSLSQIRRLEKQREATKFCWEPGSYDSRYGDT